MFDLYISTGNAAFGEGPRDAGLEVARILRELADRIENGIEDETSLFDVNGNCVGRATFDPEDV